jgi:hypothetical protein
MNMFDDAVICHWMQQLRYRTNKQIYIYIYIYIYIT